VVFLLVKLIIWTVTFLIIATFVAVICRRFYTGRKYSRLDMARQGSLPLLEALKAGRKIEGEESYRHRPGSPGWTAVEECLLQCVESVDGRVEAARLLDSLGYTRHYLRKLKKGSRWDSALAAERLGRIRYAAAVPYLIEALGSDRKDVRLMAINSLGVIGDESAIPHLMNALKQTLKDKDGEDVSVRVVKSAIISFGTAVLRDLMGELKSQDWMVRATALDILGEIGDSSTSAEFSRMLGDPEHEVRAKAAKGLGKLKVREAIPLLLAALKDPDWVVRLHSARALGLIGAESAIQPLKAALTDKSWQVRAAASEAMALAGGAGFIELLNVLIDSSDRYARDQALDQLSRAGFYTKLKSFLEGNDLILKENGKTADKYIGRDLLLEMARILSSLTQDRLEGILASLSTMGHEAAKEDIAGVYALIKEVQGRKPQPKPS